MNNSIAYNLGYAAGIAVTVVLAAAIISFIVKKVQQMRRSREEQC